MLLRMALFFLNYPVRISQKSCRATIIFVRKRKADEKPDENEAIFMAAPALIGYEATGRKTDSQLDEIIQKYEEFQKDATPFFA